MSTSIEILDPCTSGEWLRFVSSHPDAGAFHHPAWSRMLQDTYGFRMFVVCVKEGDEIKAGIPFADVRSLLTGKRWVSLPFSDYCQPLFAKHEAESVTEIVRYLENQRGVATSRIEVRWPLPASSHGFADETFVYHTLALQPDSQAVYAMFDKQAVQRSIMKAGKEGIVVRESKTLDEFYAFYRLQLMTRKRLGVPAQPRGFFEAVWKHMLESGLGFALISYKDDVPVAGGVFFTFGKTMCYKYSASDHHYRHTQATHAFIWEAIQRACAKGCHTFDFGRSEKGNVGLCRFKRGWGAVEHPLRYTILAESAPQRSGHFADDIVGFVIRNSPAVVCKLSGELLYKHFA